MNNYMNEILAEMAKYNIAPATNPRFTIDGAINRYRVTGDKPGTKNGWCIIHLSHLSNTRWVVWAIFGSWKLGISHKWSSKNEKLNNYDHTKIKKEITIARMQVKK